MNKYDTTSTANNTKIVKCDINFLVFIHTIHRKMKT